MSETNAMNFEDAVEVVNRIVAYNIDQFEANVKAGKRRTSDLIIPFLVGEPGVGKTAIPNKSAADLELPYSQAIVAQYDAGEMAGIPYITKRTIADPSATASGKVGTEIQEEVLVRARPDYLPTDTFGIFNLDELPQAFLANQNVVSQLVNEYRVGRHEISQALSIVATGNNPKDKAGTTTMPTHLRDRLMFITIVPDHECWLKYAAQKNLHPVVRAYIHNHHQKLHDFDPTREANPTPRSWEKVSSIAKMDFEPRLRRKLFAGQIGDGYATEFEAYFRHYDSMPDINAIIAKPRQGPIYGADQVSLQYIVLATLASRANEKNINNIMTYVERLGEKKQEDLMAFFAQDCFMQHPDLAETEAASAWILNHGYELLMA